MKKVYSSIRGMFDFDPVKSLAFGEIVERAKNILKVLIIKKLFCLYLRRRIYLSRVWVRLLIL